MTRIERVSITDPCVLIRINQFYRQGMSGKELYEATRGVWRVGVRREKAKFAMAVFGGHVKEIYEINSWYPAGTTPYETRKPDTYKIKGRWEFLGEIADEKIRQIYLDKNIAHYFIKGAQNPIMYVNA